MEKPVGSLHEEISQHGLGQTTWVPTTNWRNRRELMPSLKRKVNCFEECDFW